MSNSDPANTTEKQKTSKATTVSVNKKKVKDLSGVMHSICAF